METKPPNIDGNGLHVPAKSKRLTSLKVGLGGCERRGSAVRKRQSSLLPIEYHWQQRSERVDRDVGVRLTMVEVLVEGLGVLSERLFENVDPRGHGDLVRHG